MGTPTKIIVIHDELSEDDPLLLDLADKYGESNIKLFKEAKNGLGFVLDEVEKNGTKMLVILDWDFAQQNYSGEQVLDNIRKKTNLVNVIIWTARPGQIIKKLENESEFIKFVNHHVFAIVQRNESMKNLMKYIDNAIHDMDTRLECAFELWLQKRSVAEKKTPYLSYKGNVYTSEDVLTEIRQNTEAGKKITQLLMYGAIELLSGTIKQ